MKGKKTYKISMIFTITVELIFLIWLSVKINIPGSAVAARWAYLIGSKLIIGIIMWALQAALLFFPVYFTIKVGKAAALEKH